MFGVNVLTSLVESETHRQAQSAVCQEHGLHNHLFSPMRGQNELHSSIGASRSTSHLILVRSLLATLKRYVVLRLAILDERH